MAAVRVLIVDDDEELRLLCRLCLEAHGAFEVLCASDGGEALALAEKEPLDLILIDLFMPGMDGPTTIRQLRSRPATAQLPAVLMTAVGEHPSAQPAQWAAIIQKPFDVRRLGDQLLQILAAKHADGVS
jgi:two-component system, OmpR family, response regulator